MCTTKHSGFVHTGCGCSKAKPKIKVEKTPQPNPEPQPENETVKDVKDEAEKYSNTEVPGYNKLFAGTLLLFTFLIVTQSGN